MVPLKISRAFLMSGSFLKSSLLNTTGAGFFSAGAVGAASTGFADAVAGAGWVATGAGGGGAATVFRFQLAGVSALMNLIIAFAWPSSASLVASKVWLLSLIHISEPTRPY